MYAKITIWIQENQINDNNFWCLIIGVPLSNNINNNNKQIKVINLYDFETNKEQILNIFEEENEKLQMLNVF